MNNKKGLCSGWLIEQARSAGFLDSGTQLGICKIPCYWRPRSPFVVPEDLSIPLIMVGPGTGVAPFLGFLQHRMAQRSSNPAMAFGESWLFFGCRNPSQDFIFQDELESFVQQGVLDHLVVAFLQIDPCCYVQDKLREYSLQVYDLLQNGAILFVCGYDIQPHSLLKITHTL